MFTSKKRLKGEELSTTESLSRIAGIGMRELNEA